MDLSPTLKETLDKVIPKDVLDYYPDDVFCSDIFDLLSMDDDWLIKLIKTKKLDCYELVYALYSLTNHIDKNKSTAIYLKCLKSPLPVIRMTAIDCLSRLGTRKARNIIKKVMDSDSDEVIKQAAQQFLEEKYGK
jgi:hypothetical protein